LHATAACSAIIDVYIISEMIKQLIKRVKISFLFISPLAHPDLHLLLLPDWRA
jgi:hypothetical protein